jgi:precorrin-3B C17-methyltransferase
MLCLSLDMSAKVYLVGIGPGQAELITPQARDAIEKVAVVIGHPDTLGLVAELMHGKEVLAINQNPLERSRLAVEKAQAGQDIAIISSGDPGIYAIAATFFGYLKDHNITLDVEVVPGLGLAGYASARLGAPMGNDTASISLTDQGTSWTVIQKRLESAAADDFVIAIYNPFGKLGPARFQEALNIIAKRRPTSTPVGILSQAATPNEKVQIITLGDLAAMPLPVDTLVIIGNSQSYSRDGRMVTPRLYQPGVGY